MPTPSSTGPDDAHGGVRFALRALRHRNYRLFFGGQSVSLVGTWLTRVATSWLVYRLTHSALLLGLASFVGLLPTFLLAPFAGVWVDRTDRHRLLVVTQVLAMLQSAALAALAFTHVITVPQVIALNAVQGVINAFDAPARQAFVVEMIEDRADLPNAIALNSSMFNGARLVGPAVAGVLIAALGEGGCFALDAVSYLAVIASLLAMRVPARPRAPRTTRAAQELVEGVRYAFGFPPIRAVLLLVAWVSLVGMPYTVLMPVMATRVLHGGPNTLGLCMAATGLGALGGAFYLATRATVVGLGRTILVSVTLFGAALLAFSLTHSLALALPVLFLTGGGMMTTTASCNTVLQTILDEDKRGRVMSLYAMAVFGASPFGSLLAGTLAEHIGAPRTIAVCGAACLAAAALFARSLPGLRRHVRPIYVRLGILSDEPVVEST